MNRPQESRLADHIDAALCAMSPATTARLSHPDRAQRTSAIAIMAQTLAVQLDSDRDSRAGAYPDVQPQLPIDLQ